MVSATSTGTAASASAGRGTAGGPGLRGLGVRRVQRLGEHVVEQRGTEGARASPGGTSGHGTAPAAARGPFGPHDPGDLDDVEDAGQEVQGGRPRW